MHKPGPWILDGLEVTDGSDILPERICEIGYAGDWKANGCLIVVSPDLLKELEESTVCLEFVLRGDVIPAALINQIDRNHDLINKVKGE